MFLSGVYCRFIQERWGTKSILCCIPSLCDCSKYKKTEPVSAGANTTIYVWLLGTSSISGIETRHIPLHLHQPWRRFWLWLGQCGKRVWGDASSLKLNLTDPCHTGPVPQLRDARPAGWVQCQEPNTGQEKFNSIVKTIHFSYLPIIYLRIYCTVLYSRYKSMDNLFSLALWLIAEILKKIWHERNIISFGTLITFFLTK